MAEQLIYIYDKNSETRALFSDVLIKDGYSAVGFFDDRAFFSELKNKCPDLVIFDISSCASEKRHMLLHEMSETKLPVIAMQNDYQDTLQRITALTLGADICIPKTISQIELTAVVKALLRRIHICRSEAAVGSMPEGTAEPDTLLSYGDVVLNLRSHSSYCNDKALYLTPNEFNFLNILFKRNAAVSKEELRSLIWGEDKGAYAFHALEDLVKRLRKKLRALDSHVNIVSVWAYGYYTEFDDCISALEGAAGNVTG